MSAIQNKMVPMPQGNVCMLALLAGSSKDWVYVKVVKYFYWLFQGSASFVDHLCYSCLVFVTLSCLFISALWSPAGKGLAFRLSFMMFYCVFVTLPCGILGQVR